MIKHATFASLFLAFKSRLPVASHGFAHVDLRFVGGKLRPVKSGLV